VVFGERFRFGHAGLAIVAVASVVITLGVIGLSRRTADTGTTAEPEEPSAGYGRPEPIETAADPKPGSETEPTPH